MFPNPIDVERNGRELVLVEAEPIRVLIADAQPIVRAGFTAMLARERDMGVAGETGGAEEAVALASELRPTIVLLDLDLPGIGALEAARRISDDPGCAGVGVVILAARESDEDMLAALRAGACAFLSKSACPEELMEAVRLVAAGGSRLGPSATRRLIAEYAAQPQPHLPSVDQLGELTAREQEVIALVAAGLRNDEIAERFVISPATVKTHVSRALRKLDARDRAQLVAMAYQLGLVRAGARRPLHSVRPPRPALVTTTRA
jgi:DNA-binding NarL/FixJ family response regulator